jgi:hypothetical protein
MPIHTYNMDNVWKGVGPYTSHLDDVSFTPSVHCSFNQIVNLMVNMGGGDQCTSFNTCFDMGSIILFFEKLVSLLVNNMHVMSCNDGYESSHQPINLVTLKPPCIQGKSLFWCPMIRFNTSLDVMCMQLPIDLWKSTWCKKYLMFLEGS